MRRPVLRNQDQRFVLRLLKQIQNSYNRAHWVPQVSRLSRPGRGSEVSLVAHAHSARIPERRVESRFGVARPFVRDDPLKPAVPCQLTRLQPAAYGYPAKARFQFGNGARLVTIDSLPLLLYYRTPGP
jgi:hypothetical protein